VLREISGHRREDVTGDWRKQAEKKPEDMRQIQMRRNPEEVVMSPTNFTYGVVKFNSLMSNARTICKTFTLF
jgi:hypothetical protein